MIRKAQLLEPALKNLIFSFEKLKKEISNLFVNIIKLPTFLCGIGFLIGLPIAFTFVIIKYLNFPQLRFLTQVIFPLIIRHLPSLISQPMVATLTLLMSSPWGVISCIAFVISCSQRFAQRGRFPPIIRCLIFLSIFLNPILMGMTAGTVLFGRFGLSVVRRGGQLIRKIERYEKSISANFLEKQINQARDTWLKLADQAAAQRTLSAKAISQR